MQYYTMYNCTYSIHTLYQCTYIMSINKPSYSYSSLVRHGEKNYFNPNHPCPWHTWLKYYPHSLCSSGAPSSPQTIRKLSSNNFFVHVKSLWGHIWSTDKQSGLGLQSSYLVCLWFLILWVLFQKLNFNQVLLKVN